MHKNIELPIPMFIAEISSNHNQSLTQAKKLFQAAYAAGATAVKLQTFTADSMTLAHDGPGFVINDPASLWHGRSLYDLYCEGATPYEWHEELFNYGRSLGLEVFSSPFDEQAVDFLEALDAPRYKIASFENTHIPLLKKVAATTKPVIVSTGMASIEDIQLAVDTLRSHGAGAITLLKCTSNYPADASEANLITIADMRERFGCEVGLSDHTKGIGVAVAAVALGATVVEKHFTLDRRDGGLDAEFSMQPDEFRQMVEECERARAALGQVHYDGSEREQTAKQFRRSVYFCASLPAGTVLTREHIQVIRPAYGLHPKFYEDLLGQTLLQDVEFGTPVHWDHVQHHTK